MIKHSIDDKEALAELLDHPGFAPLMRELDALADRQGADVLTYDLSTGDESELVRRKCRHEGAHKLLAHFKMRLETLKGKQKA